MNENLYGMFDKVLQSEYSIIEEGSKKTIELGEDAKYGTMETYSLFDGVIIAFMDINLGNNNNIFFEDRLSSRLLQINHCVNGRYSYAVGDDRIVYFGKGDLFKFDWCNELDTTLPTLMIVSGVFQYFHEEDILEFIRKAKDIFENAELIFDATNKFGIRYSNIYVKRTGNKSALMYFYIENPREFAKKANCQLIECRGFYKDALKMLSSKLSLYSKISMKIADKRNNAMILHLKL